MSDVAAPPAFTEISVVRHGETDWNAQMRYQGHSHNELNADGERQALALGMRFAGDAPAFDRIISSDLMRAHRTAEIIAEQTGLPMQTDERLRERKVGIFRGLTPREASEQHPAEFAAFKSDDRYVVPEGESKQALHDRAVAFLAELASASSGKRLIVVTHGGVIEAMIRHAFSLPLAMHLPFSNFNAACNRFIRRGDHWVIATLGDISHLRELGKRHPVREEKLLD